jgi:large subunit ribosomal protein L15e
VTRARSLGYKAKQGYTVVRARVAKGRRTRRRPRGGRKHKSYYFFKQPQISLQATAEQKVNRTHKNMEVLNSYWVGDDGNYQYYEVILADPSKPTVNVSSAIRQGKAFRGLTSAGNSRTKSKKKTPNKRRRMKAKAKKPFHPEEPVKKKVEKPVVKKRAKGTKSKKVAKRKVAKKAPAKKAPEKKAAEKKE